MVPTAACQEKGMRMDRGRFWVLWWLPGPLLAALLCVDVEVDLSTPHLPVQLEFLSIKLNLLSL